MNTQQLPLKRTDDYEIRGNDDTVIAKIYTFQNDATGFHKLPTRQESDMYANLFTAAPELLDYLVGLKEMFEAVKRGHDIFETIDDEIHFIDVLIAKAKGGF